MLTAVPEHESALRERRCIATGAILPEEKLVRFVVGPDGDIVPDIDAKLPGRGLWLSADRHLMTRPALKNDFAKAARAKVSVAPDLAAHVEHLIVARMLSDLGLARRAGLLSVGFDNVVRALGTRNPPSVLIEAADAAADGKRKLEAAARGLKIETIGTLKRAELGLALGRENVVHAALRPGALADRLKLNSARLAALRAQPCSTENESTE